MPATPKIPRRLPAVAQDRMFRLSRWWCDAAFHYLVSFEGRLNEVRLRRAVRLAMDAEPVFGCRYIEARKPCWERRDDLDLLPLCEVVETTEVQRELERFAARPCDATRDPLIQVCLIRAASDTLCLKFNHASVDGAGAKELLYLIARIYRSLENPEYRVTPNLRGRGSLQFLRQIGLRRCLRAMSFRSGKRAESLWCFPSRNLSETGTLRFARRGLSPAEFTRLRDYAGSLSASWNDVLLAAFFRALWQFTGFPSEIPQPVYVPMDLRLFLARGKTPAICNFVAVLYPAVARIPGETFADTVLRVKQSMLTLPQQKEYAILFQVLLGLSHHLLLEKMGQRGEMLARKCRETGVTAAHFSNNHTIVPSKLDFGIPISDVDQFTPAGVPPALFMGALFFRGSLRFSITYFNPAVTTEDVERFLDTFMEELSAAAGRPAMATSAQA
jgi:NRPS condensation-like uncharacterized protein